MDVNRILLDILVVLLAAKLAAELADRVNIPAVVGEIAAGVIIGPSVLGWVHESEALQTLAQLGVILLLLEVGLEMDLDELGSVGRAALSVAVVGVIVPLVTGAGAGLALGMDGKEALFVGAALTATSVGITARVFGDLRALATVEAKTVLGAAVADDVLGLVILTVVTRIATGGSVSPLGIVWVVVVAVGFVVLATLIGVRIVPPMFAWVRRYSRSAGTLVAIALAFTLAVSELAHAAELAPIVGAFVAGIALARSSSADRVRRELSPVAHLLVPVFFLQIGIDADIGQFVKPSVIGIAAVLLVVGVLGKMVASVGMIGSPGDRFLVGIGMIPRGEVGLIFATLGLNNHVFGEDVYAALLLVVLITTVATPPALRWRLLALRERRRASSGAAASGGVALVHLDDDSLVTLDAEPLPSDALVVALRAARLCGEHAAAPPLLEWLEAFPTGPRRWDDASRAEFFAMLRRFEPSSLRLLTASGVLQRALPELDDAVATLRPAALEIDPLATLRMPRLSRVRELMPDEDDEPPFLTALLLAALVLDATGDDSDRAVVIGRRTVARLDLGARVEQSVAALAGDAGLLRAAARRSDGLSEENVLQLAVHIETPEQAEALLLLSCSGFEAGSHEEDRLRALYRLVQEALAHPELVGREARNEVERRRSDALRVVSDPAVRSRIETAPRAYVLAQTAEDLARQASLCEPPPHRSETRVVVDEVRIEIAARDRVGLLARTTGVLFDLDCSIIRATATTWPDGVAVASYAIEAANFPDARELQQRLEKLLSEPLVAKPVPDIELTFDDASSPWHTRCTVVGPDRPGLLHALTVAFAAAGVSVHAARVATDGDRAVDEFELSDKQGAKLDERTKAKVVDTAARGAAPRRRLFDRRAKYVIGVSPRPAAAH